MATAKPRRLRGHNGTVTCCIASRERPGFIATSGEDGCICWFDMRCKDVLFTMDLVKKPISSICFKPGNEDVVYASSGTEVMCVDLHMASSWKPLETYNYNKEEINQIVYRPKSSLLAAADDSGDIKIVDVRHQYLYKTLRAGHTSICSSVQFLPWRPWEVVTGGLDAKLVLWDLSNERPYRIVDFGLPDMNNYRTRGQCFNPAFIHALAIPEVDMLDRSGKICAAARGDGVVDIIDIDSELAAPSYKSCKRARKGSQSRSGGIKPISKESMLDQKRGSRLHLDYTMGGHTAAVSCVSFSLFGEKGKFIISGGNDASVKVWDCFKHLDAAQSSSSDILRQNITLSDKVNWLCTTPTDWDNIVVCDTTNIVKIYSVI